MRHFIQISAWQKVQINLLSVTSNLIDCAETNEKIQEVKSEVMLVIFFSYRAVVQIGMLPWVMLLTSICV